MTFLPVKKKSLKKEKNEVMPEKISPQLALLSQKVPYSATYFFERKYDGYRLIVFIDQSKVKIQTRNGNNWTEKFPKLCEHLEKLPIDNVIFDGEIVHYDKEGRTDFSELQNFMHQKDVKLHFVIFDVLYASGINLKKASFDERRTFLEELFKNFESDRMISLSESIPYSKNILEKVCQKKWEGIIAKHKDAKYQEKRDASWLKIKCSNREEFVVIGLTKPQGSRDFFGSLLIAEATSTGLQYRGKVGTGFTQKTLKNLFEEFKNKKTSKEPNINKLDKNGVLFWIKPHFYAEIDYTEKTKAGSLRHPVFKGLRLDKTFDPKASTDRDKLINLTHPDKILFKDVGLTKKDLWLYYEKVMPSFLKGAEKSLLTLVRCPQGSEKSCFFQKHFDSKTQNPKLIQIKEKNKKENHSYVNEKNDVKALVQLGVLEIHQWNSKTSDTERPLYLVFDLDPDEKMDFEEVVKASHTIKKELEASGLTVYVRTTGGKGLHLVTPLTQKLNWDEAYEFSKEIALALSSKYKNFIATSSKAKRKGKIFIDYMRNSRGSTSISNYSPRAKANAPVATPLHWKEVNSKLNPQNFTIKTIPKRLARQKKDPWEEFWKEIEK